MSIYYIKVDTLIYWNGLLYNTLILKGYIEFLIQNVVLPHDATHIFQHFCRWNKMLIYTTDEHIANTRMKGIKSNHKG